MLNGLGWRYPRLFAIAPRSSGRLREESVGMRTMRPARRCNLQMEAGTMSSVFESVLALKYGAASILQSRPELILKKCHVLVQCILAGLFRVACRRSASIHSKGESR